MSVYFHGEVEIIYNRYDVDVHLGKNYYCHYIYSHIDMTINVRYIYSIRNINIVCYISKDFLTPSLYDYCFITAVVKFLSARYYKNSL